MSKGQRVITAVVVEGRSKSEVARDYDVSRQWVQQLCRRYAAEGATAFVEVGPGMVLSGMARKAAREAKRWMISTVSRVESAMKANTRSPL